MASANPTHVLTDALYAFQAAQMCLREWEASEDRETAQAVLCALEGTRTLTEFIAVLRGCVQR